MVAFDTTSWDDIREWMSVHAPASFELLAPAQPNGSVHVRKATELELPELVSGFLDSVGGMVLGDGDGLWGAYWPLTPDDAVAKTLEQRASRPAEVLLALEQRDQKEAGEPAGAWLDQFVALGDAFSGDFLALDLRPGPMSGCVRLFVRDSAAVAAPVWPDVQSMVDQLSAALRNQSAVIGWMPGVEDGLLVWDVAPTTDDESRSG